MKIDRTVNTKPPCMAYANTEPKHTKMTLQGHKNDVNFSQSFYVVKRFATVRTAETKKH